jgi:DNA-binding MarR family transcriptional regulator/GNAT superfamily N-acetyltransferase
MENEHIRQVRRFNRLVTQRVGALDESYLSLGRPLGEARVIYEIGAASPRALDVKSLRSRLGLDSGYLSRLLRSLEKQDAVRLAPAEADGRIRQASLTETGSAAFAAYDALSDRLAESMLAPLGDKQRQRLIEAMSEVERLLRAGAVAVMLEPADSADGRRCIEAYYAELAQRFETGFDPKQGNPFEPADMTPPHGWLVLARLEGQAVGCGALKRLGDEVGEIKRLWIAPDARGLGIANRIMDRLEAIAGETGFRTLKLDTNRALHEAHALYRKRGYREVARYNDNPYADHWFEKRIETE